MPASVALPAAPPAARPTVLLTGGSGVIGTALLPELADCHVIALTHRAPCPGADEQVRGDLTAYRLGLGKADYAALARRVDVVVHAAAVTGFSSGADTTHRLNEAGTRRIADFTADADARLYHLSTAFVARRELTRAGLGKDTGDASARPEDYVDSKRAGEAVVRDSGVPAVIVRPSVVIGDSVTGHISAFQGMHAVLLSLLRGLLPLLPAPRHSRVDFVPCDLVARVLARLVAEGRTGGEVWVTAGENAIAVERLLELTAKAGAELGITPVMPRMVGQDMVDRLIRPVFISTLRPGMRRRFDDMLALTALFADAGPFPTSLGAAPVAAPVAVAAPSTAEVETALLRTVTHLARAKGLAPAHGARHHGGAHTCRTAPGAAAGPGEELLAG
ncbi:SDR family oxidoreductase [Streptomyces sp. NPDC054796]